MLALTKVEIEGFKSFPHKTKLDFRERLNVIVGPNGSGKSNLLDAILFAFGEHSHKLLRSSKLEDFIFSGTDALKPMSLASVRLTFTEMGGGSDTVLERRAFRDGESEYLMDGRPVRAKDVDAFFSSHSLGKNAVFYTSQGEVERKVIARPQDMRQWFAEATGIAPLLAQKDLTLERMKRTRENIVRLSDLIDQLAEVETGLRVQKDTAERYLALKAEYAALDIEEIRREASSLFRQMESLSARAESRHDEASDLEEKIAASHRAVAENREAATKAESDEDAARIARSDAERALADMAAEIRVLEEKSVSLSRAVLDAERETARLSEAAASDEAALAECGRTALQLAKSREMARDDESQATEAAGFAESEYQAASAALEALRAKLASADLAAFEKKHAAEAVARRLEEVEAEAARIAETKARLAAQKAEDEAAAKSIRENVEGREAESAEMDALIAALDERSAEIDKEVRSIETELAGARALVAAAGARLATLKSLVAEGEGYSGAKKAALASGDARDLAGAVAAPKGLEAALARVLADLPQAVVARGRSRAFDVAAKASEGELRVIIQEDTAGTAAPDLGEASGVRVLWDEVLGEAGVVDALRLYIGDIAIAESADAGRALVSRFTALAGFVTMDGTLFYHRGMVAVGAPGAAAHVFTRRADIRAADAEVSRLTLVERALAERLARAKRESEEVTSENQAARGGAARVQAELGVARDNLARITQRAEATERDLTEAGWREADVLVEVKELTGRREASAREAAEYEAAAAAFKTDVGGAQEALAALASARDAANEALNRARSEVELIAERIRHNDEMAALVKSRLERVDARRRELAAATENARGAKESTSQRIAALKDEIAAHEKRIADYEARLTALRTSRDVAQAAADSAEADIERYRAALDRLRDSIGNQEVERAKLSARLDELARNASERYSADLARIVSEKGQTATFVYFPETPETSESATTPWVVELSRLQIKRIREGKEFLDSEINFLGPVNVGAIEEHASVSSRLATMIAQRSDVEKALDDLRSFLASLEKRAAAIYEKNLAAVGERFDEYFKFLFGGGGARIVLDPDAFILDSDVEIKVEVPGKRAVNLSALSGGERTLIFLALFLAVCTVRGAGFCVIDEADSSLDDANVVRFVRLVKERCEGLQFFLITHNKITMEAADKLVGVVSRPRGVSNVLEVTLTDAEKMAEPTKRAASGE
jgi:chromosome segregation protein